ncbi:serine/threonine-protein kinase [Gloeothece verrucosa]|uniref:non-specific serine/threonine protein kinase n=1 Tax=Gloeothece verrucosa (strain PCC 7822) TaxID=497965 RepID=E0UIM3_GLOV7|nr:serine/threonine-protein kinase [Gloeothece verrucosa]ADN12217.1 serine/threonine protein kinase [Gloeothece verrucosa PCC 7822]
MSDILLSRYKINRSLASGGFGDTYLAQDLALPGNPLCVVKHLKPKVLSSQALPIAKTLFEREAEYLYQLGEHSQIPRLYAHFQQEGEFYLVQEFIEGNELTQELIEGQLWSESKTIELLRSILEVLAVVHQKNVIHRDIKPSNIMRRKADGKLVLIDFGAVKEFSSLTVTSGGQTSLTVAIGTPGYMPPEQAHGKPTLASDIYAVGMIAIQALTGVNPSLLPTEPQTGEIIWRDHARVSDQFATILNKMIHEYHRLRYQNAREALEDLNSLNFSNPTVYSTEANSSNPTLVVSPGSNDNSPRTLNSPKIFPWVFGLMGGLVLAATGTIIFNRFISNSSTVVTVSPTPDASASEPPPTTFTPSVAPDASTSEPPPTTLTPYPTPDASASEPPPTTLTPSPTPDASPSVSLNPATWLSASGKTTIPQLDSICWGNNQINSAQTVFSSPPYQGSLRFNNPKTGGCFPGDTLTGTFELSSQGNYCTGQITVTWYENNQAHLQWLINNLGTDCPVSSDRWEIDTHPVRG